MLKSVYQLNYLMIYDDNTYKQSRSFFLMNEFKVRINDTDVSLLHENIIQSPGSIDRSRHIVESLRSLIKNWSS